MKKTFLTLATACVGLVAMAQNPLWMRYNTISPDGSQIAFSYKGDIYTVPTQGGRALQITTHKAYDSYPIWSPDSKQIAFASNRNGSTDIFVVNREGGVPKRLTTHTNNETPIAFLDNGKVLFSTSLPVDAQSSLFPGSMKQVFQVSVNGGRPELFSAINMENINISKDGKKVLYHDMKGYEDPWRKHHTSSVTRDIWLYEVDNKSFTQITRSAVENRNPVWSPDNKSFYFLSEKNGSFNVYKHDLATKTDTQLTQYSKNPVRFLSMADNGTLCFGYDGEIYTMKEGGTPQKVNIQIISDEQESNLIRQTRTSGATEISVSPSGKEIAFILRGDVFVTSTEYSTTKQITNTPEQERSVQFAPDGKKLVYASERNGIWQLYQTSIVSKDEKNFTYSTDLKEERLTQSNIASFQPKYSPDGKEVAFLEDRTTLRIINLKSKAVRTVLDGKYNYSYVDGDQWFEWSPDSRWLLSGYIGIGGWNNTDVALINADGKGEIHNLTQSGYSDGPAKWVLGGKAMIWASDRSGYRSHGSWGAQQDVYIMFFDLDAYENFRMDKEELALAEEAEKIKKDNEKKETTDKKNNKGKKAEDKKEEEGVKPLKFDLENHKNRILRLTGNSSFLGDAWLTPKGDKLYYQARFEGGYDLWVRDFKDESVKIALKNAGGGELLPDAKGENLFVCTGGGIKQIELSKGSSKSIPFELIFDYKPAQERKYIFEHVWQQVQDKFYVKDIHGVDWAYYKKTYEKFLPHINNNQDFAVLLSEMLGELNGSHTGARNFAGGATLRTAALGVIYDYTYQGDGLKIAEVLKGGPFSVKETGVTAGCIIESIDGIKIEKGTDFFPMLEGKADKKLLLSIHNPATGKKFTTTIKAISTGAEQGLMYKRWVERNKEMVKKLSNGRVAYVHVQGMDSPSFRTVYSELLSDENRQKEAVIVDTRHNGGGWLHDDLITLLTGKEYQQFVPRGKYIGSDPFNKWLRPSCVLVCEDNYSNAHGFPWIYKELKVGKLIGAPVPGTMTAVWWETQIDPSIVFGIPQVGCMDLRGNYMENVQLNPDIEVYNKPERVLQGYDDQLERAVQEMLKVADSHTYPSRPVK